MIREEQREDSHGLSLKGDWKFRSLLHFLTLARKNSSRGSIALAV